MGKQNKKKDPSLIGQSGHWLGNPEPWLDQFGREKNIEELRKISATWSPDQWESYARFLSEKEKHDPKEITYEVQVLNVLHEEQLQEQLAEKRVFGYLSRQTAHPHLDAAVKKAVAALGENEREVIQLAFWKDQSQREIARALNISRTRVRMLLERGLRRLKTRLLVELITMASSSRN